MLSGGIVVACLAVLLAARGETRTVSQVRSDIQQIALLRSTGPHRDDGGPVGPWWIAASTVDPDSGQLRNFRLSSGQMQVAARTARIVIDPEADTFSFELIDVAFTRVPEPDEEVADHYVLALDHHVLGPAPYGINIIGESDKATRRQSD
jgi:hypothetical protein